jgi:hypothetical protein
MADFIPGLQLSELFFRDAVRPILDRRFPSLAYSAARIDTGSDVLGFDTPMSRDHGWGPRCQLFLSEADHVAVAREVVRVMGDELPFHFFGYPTNYVYTDSPCMLPTGQRPINHLVDVTTIATFFRGYVGVDPSEGVSEKEWLSIASQPLRTIRAGRVFHDGLGELERCRETLNWYPHDLWLYVMGCQWQRISQEEPFVGRTGDVGDELGSRVIAARLVEDVMRLCFLIEREYPPYSKWLGTAFDRLACAAALSPILNQVLDGKTWKQRESHLCRAYLIVQRLHNALGVTEHIDERVDHFHSRPYLVPHAGRFAEALQGAIRSDAVKLLPRHVGAVWQFSNSVDMLESVEHRRALMSVYR